MKNQYAVSLLVFTALACHLPTKAAEKPEKFFDTTHVFALLNLLDRENKADMQDTAKILAGTFPPSLHHQEVHQPVAHFEPDEEDDLAEAVRLSLAPDFGNPFHQEEGAFRRAIEESELLSSGINPETSSSTPGRESEDEKESDPEKSWVFVDDSMEDPSQEEARKQQERETKEVLEKEIVASYPGIKQTYAAYKGVQAEVSKAQNESYQYPDDSEERKKAKEKYEELSSRKFDIYRAFEDMKKEEGDKLGAYLPLLSGEEKEIFGKKVEDSRRLLKELREKVDKKHQEQEDAWTKYNESGEEGKDLLRRNWLDRYDEHKELEKAFDEAMINESKKFHDYFLAIVGAIESAEDEGEKGQE